MTGCPLMSVVWAMIVWFPDVVFWEESLVHAAKIIKDTAVRMCLVFIFILFEFKFIAAKIHGL